MFHLLPSKKRSPCLLLLLLQELSCFRAAITKPIAAHSSLILPRKAGATSSSASEWVGGSKTDLPVLQHLILMQEETAAAYRKLVLLPRECEGPSPAVSQPLCKREEGMRQKFRPVCLVLPGPHMLVTTELQSWWLGADNCDLHNSCLEREGLLDPTSQCELYHLPEMPNSLREHGLSLGASCIWDKKTL